MLCDLQRPERLQHLRETSSQVRISWPGPRRAVFCLYATIRKKSNKNVCVIRLSCNFLYMYSEKYLYIVKMLRMLSCYLTTAVRSRVACALRARTRPLPILLVRAWFGRRQRGNAGGGAAARGGECRAGSRCGCCCCGYSGGRHASCSGGG